MNLVGVGESGKLASARTGTRFDARSAVFYGVCGVLFASSAGATIAACLSMSTMGEMPMPGGWTMSMMWLPMCGKTWLRVAASFVGMWIAMMIAMMLPSFAPALWRYGEALRRAGHTRVAMLRWLAGLGYFTVWAALGVTVFALGAALAGLEMRMPALSRAIPVSGGAVVLLAGTLQLSAWKAHYLHCCRRDPECDHAILPSRAATALRYGLRLGLHCCYCCAGLTAVLVVMGVMNPLAMAVVTAAITLERLAPRGRLVARGVGFAIVGMGLLMIVRAAALV
ncbi:DUF2182 domain-containing protein [Burkholderia sp. WSM2230]|uniref:DUF2182 domain-containing protein n=1 Tax=Burkholderia sp. WSM2230 TaxID=944435 RepID=UPI00041F0FEA|nr:DUF2182 domain-containing protein [Burkholderia sp. WSM2230]